jgi:hypothetical protein
MNLECPKFNVGEDAQRWLMMAKRALRLTFKGAGTDEEKVDYAIMHLRGHAAAWANDLGPTSWADFETAFLRKYEAPINLNALLRQAYTLRQKEGQPVRELANIVEGLMSRMRGFPNEYFAEVMREALAPSLKAHVQLSATTYSDVLQQALRAEGYVGAEGVIEIYSPPPLPNPPPSTKPPQEKDKGKEDFDNMLKSMERLTLALTSTAERADKRKGPSGPLICHNCKKEGHFARDCPNPRVQMAATFVDATEESPCALHLKGMEAQALALHGQQLKRGRTDGPGTGITIEEARRIVEQEPPLPRPKIRAPERTSQVANLMDQLRTTPAKISLWTYIEESPRARADLEKALVAVKEAQARAEAAGVSPGMRVGVALSEKDEVVQATVAVNEATGGVSSLVGIGPDIPVYRVAKCVIQVGNHSIEAIVDTGASGTTMSHVVARRLQLYQFMVDSPHSLLTASGERYRPLGMLAKVPLKVGRLSLPVHVTVTDTGDYDVLLGNDWLVPAGAMVDYERKRLVYRLSPDVQESVPITCGLSVHAHARYIRLVPTEYSDIQMVVEEDDVIAEDSEIVAEAHPGAAERPYILSDSEEEADVVSEGAVDEGGLEEEGLEGEGVDERSEDEGDTTIGTGLGEDDMELLLTHRHDLMTIPPIDAFVLPHYRDWSEIVGLVGPATALPRHYFCHTIPIDHEEGERAHWFHHNLERIVTPTREDEYPTDWMERNPLRCYASNSLSHVTLDSYHTLVAHGTTLTGEQQAEVTALCDEFVDLFATEPQQMGHVLNVQHTIKTEGKGPISRRPHRASHVEQEIIRAEVNELLAQGVIRPSKSPWSFPVVLVPKKDGGHRMCIDYRSLNEITTGDAYPLPLIDDILGRLSGCCYFSKMDAKSAYHCISVAEEDIPKTAFATPEGLYEYVRMPFGLKNAPATFQRAISSIFRSHSNAVPYLDDILVFSKTWEEHVVHVKQALELLRDSNILLKASKCFFGASETSYLGFIISDRGVAPDPDKVSAVRGWPQPRSKTDVKSFLGLASYYRRFIKGFAEIARPLHALTRHDAPLEWTQACETAFERLKDALMAAPILSYPDFHRPFLLQTDFCQAGLGAVLAQVDEEGREHVICYASRSTRGPETHLAPTHGECLALVWGVQHFDPYLRLVPFTVQTDHNALTWLMTSQNLTGKLARWSLILQEYNFTVEHRPGRVHNNVDALSRMPRVGDAEPGEILSIRPESWVARAEHNGMWQGGMRVYTALHAPPSPPRSANEPIVPPDGQDDVSSHTPIPPLVDPPFEDVASHVAPSPKRRRRLLRTTAPPVAIAGTSSFPGGKPVASVHEIYEDEEAMWVLNGGEIPREWEAMVKKRVRAKVKSYVMVEGKLMYRKRGSAQLLYVPPVAEREAWIQFYHNMGHFGVEKTTSLTAANLWWYGLGEDVAACVKHCDICTLNKGGFPTAAELASIPVEAPWRRVYMDIAHMPASVHGNKLCLVAVDHFTKWPEVMCSPSFTSHDVLAFVEREIIARHGCPAVIHVDAGTHFEGVLPKGLASWGIHLEKGIREHPQSNGLVERFIQTLKGSLRRLCEWDVTRWDDNMPLALLGYRASIHASTRFSPYFLNYGRHPNLVGHQCEFLIPRTFGPDAADDVALIAEMGARTEAMRTYLDQARGNNDKAQKRQAEEYKTRRYSREEEDRVPIVVGDWVQLKPAKRHKDRWANELFCVFALEGSWVHILDSGGKPSRKPRIECRVALKGNGFVPQDFQEKHLAYERAHGKVPKEEDELEPGEVPEELEQVGIDGNGGGEESVPEERS